LYKKYLFCKAVNRCGSLHRISDSRLPAGSLLFANAFIKDFTMCANAKQSFPALIAPHKAISNTKLMPASWIPGFSQILPAAFLDALHNLCRDYPRLHPLYGQRRIRLLLKLNDKTCPTWRCVIGLD
jgi:hypothetical protein